MTRAAAFAAACWLLAPGAALACAVCQDPTDTRAAIYWDMTMFMSFLPLLTICGGGYWLYRRAVAAGAV